MKKLLILLLLPLFSFSQTFDELMTFNSEDTYKRVVIENDYQLYEEEDGEIGEIVYAWGIEGDKAQIWTYYYKGKYVAFQYYKDSYNRHKPQFRNITKNIKSKCKYDRIDGDEVIYKCPESSFKEIGFYTKDGSGLVILYL